jgi:hypothetical protein
MVSEAPISEAPISEAPISEAPISEAPISEAPISEAPRESYKYFISNLFEIKKEALCCALHSGCIT